MKYVDEFRDADLARGLARAIAQAVQPGRRYNLMEFCGGHTHAIARHGVRGLLPPEIELIHGPGCPVCVLPIGRIDAFMSANTLQSRVDRMAVGTQATVHAFRRDELMTFHVAPKAAPLDKKTTPPNAPNATR